MKCDTHIISSDTLHVNFLWKGCLQPQAHLCILQVSRSLTLSLRVLWLKNWKTIIPR